MAEVAGQHLGPGTLIARYEVLDILGAGGFGITYKGYDTRLQCEVAMKEYLPMEFAARGSDQTTVLPRSEHVAEEYQQGLKRFLDEARVLAKFKNRHIVRVSDYMEVNGTAYLVMDYEEGQSLGDLLKQRGGSLSEIEIKDIFIPILDGLKVVHEAGLLHRDIKPDNIYLRSKGPPVLLDFGAARQYTTSQTRGITAIVTPGYAPFEQYQPNGNLGAWTDLYALGATMYACIAGKPPLDAISRHPGMNVDPMAPAREVGGDRYSDVLLRTIDWMLRPAIADRPQSVDQVLPCIQGRAEPPEPVSSTRTPTQQESVAPTVRVDSAETLPASSQAQPAPSAATVMRPQQQAEEAVPPTRSGGGRIGLVAAVAAAVLIGAGAVWWSLQDRGGGIPLVGRTNPEESREKTPAQPGPEEPQPVPADTGQAKASSTGSQVPVEQAPSTEQTQPEAETLAEATGKTGTGGQATQGGDQDRSSQAPQAGEPAQAAGTSETTEPAQADGTSQSTEQSETAGTSQSTEQTETAGTSQTTEQSETAGTSQSTEQPQAAGASQAVERTETQEAGQQARAAQPSQQTGQNQSAKAPESENRDKAAEQTQAVAASPEAGRAAAAEAPDTDAQGQAAQAAQEAEQARIVAALQATGQEQEAGKPSASDQAQAARAQANEEPKVAMLQPSEGSEVETDRVTDNVDEFLSALKSESEQSGGGETVASIGQNTGQSKPASSDLDRLLQQAQEYMASSRLVAPEGANAWRVYKKVLSMDAGNPAALAGMNRIGTVYEKAAEILLAEGRTAMGRRIVDRGLNAVPNHPGLLRLRDKLRSQ